MSMANKKISLENMADFSIDEIARFLAFLQETRKEARMVTCRTEGEWGDTRGSGYWNDNIEYGFLNGLSNIPESLLSCLRDASAKKYLGEAAMYLIAHSEEIAAEICQKPRVFDHCQNSTCYLNHSSKTSGILKFRNRGPLPVEKGWHDKYNYSHFHHQPDYEPREEMIEQLLKDTKKSLEDYANNIISKTGEKNVNA